MEPKAPVNPYQSPQPSTLKVGRRGWPAMVRMGLFGLSTRRAAWGWFSFATLCAVGFAICGFFDPRFYGGCSFAFAALWYYLAIRWVDQHGSWNTDPPAD